MQILFRSVRTDSGNAVTLTLLGLAVAILAGVVVLFVIGKQRPEPIPLSNVVAERMESEEEEVDPRAGWNLYENETLLVSFEYPPGWIVATGTILGVPVVTAYDAAQDVHGTTTFGVHEVDTRMSIYPQGLPIGGFGDQEYKSTVIVRRIESSARDYRLGGTERAWATIARYGQYPETWNDAGFVFIRSHIEEEEVSYMSGDKEIDEEQYDPMTGDRIVHYGFVDPIKRAIQEEMLLSFRFLNPAVKAGQSSIMDLTDMIKVTHPKPGTVITSPLVVEGEALGTWYFEGSFPVELIDASSVSLAEVPATAQEDWMVETFVPFEVSIVFATTTSTSGTLILTKDNPSELVDGYAMLSIPVRFRN